MGLAFRRFHFAEDMGRADMLELMCCIDPTCNGTILLTELARCMVQIRGAKAEANSTVEEPSPQTGYEKFIGQLEAQAALHGVGRHAPAIARRRAEQCFHLF